MPRGPPKGPHCKWREFLDRSRSWGGDPPHALPPFSLFMLAQAHTTREHMARPPPTSCPSPPYLVCVWGLGARGGRGRSGCSRCDCRFLHLGPLHCTTPFCASGLFAALLPFSLALDWATSWMGRGCLRRLLGLFPIFFPLSAD
jgi:hypothetical protein